MDGGSLIAVIVPQLTWAVDRKVRNAQSRASVRRP
jgi:hypothetical protein